MADRKQNDERKGGVDLLEKDEQKTQKPPLYKVLIHNDDFTPVTWVIDVLQYLFRKSEAEAFRITMGIHYTGVGVAGIYTHEIAETKCAELEALATRDEHPLMCSMEPE